MRARYRMDKDLIQAVHEHVDELDIFEASTFGDLDRLTELLAYDPASVVERSGDGFTALHFAAFFGGPEVTSFLVTRGSQVDAHGTGWMTGTPLHSAASSDHVDVARVLLDAGASPDARQSGGWTPLHAAAQNGSAAMVTTPAGGRRRSDAHERRRPNGVGPGHRTGRARDDRPPRRLSPADQAAYGANA